MNVMSRKLWVIGGLGLALSACARKLEPLQEYNLGGMKQGFRDYTRNGGDICDAEPRALADELGGVNNLLAEFLSSTEKANTPTSVDYNRHVTLLKESAGSLGKVLDAHQANLKALPQCGFAKTAPFPEVETRGQELLKKAHARLSEGDWLVDVAAAQRKWEQEAPQREQAARQTWCAKDPEVGNAEVYYARAYADGRSEWLFCDGHMVQARGGGDPTLVSPENLNARERRKVKPARYYEAAQGYPTKEMDKQPTALPTSAPAAAR